MLAANRSAGVAWVVNLRNPLHTGDEEYKQWSHHSFKTQGRGHQKSKTGVSVAHKKDLCPPKIKKHIFGNIEAQLFSYSKNGLVNNLAAGLIGSDDWFRELLPSWKTATCKLTSNPFRNYDSRRLPILDTVIYLPNVGYFCLYVLEVFYNYINFIL